MAVVGAKNERNFGVSFAGLFQHRPPIKKRNSDFDAALFSALSAINRGYDGVTVPRTR